MIALLGAVPAALFVVLLVRALVPSSSAWHRRRPLGCNVCMAGWSASLIALLQLPPALAWMWVRGWLLCWWATAAICWIALELVERLPAPRGLAPPK